MKFKKLFAVCTISILFWTFYTALGAFYRGDFWDFKDGAAASTLQVYSGGLLIGAITGAIWVIWFWWLYVDYIKKPR